METTRTPQFDWDRLWRSGLSGIHGSDATYRVAWAKALCDTLLANTVVQTLALGETSDDPTGVLPYFRDNSNAPLGARVFKALPDAHAGRTSLLVRDNDPATCKALLRKLSGDLQGWDAFQITLVNGSTGHSALTELVAAGELRARCIAKIDSPYIELADSWDATFESLPKKLRWTIRKAEKDLSAQGTLTYEPHTSSATAERLFAAIYEIERQSWKQKSGTSITSHDWQQRFYEALAKHAGADGIFSAHVLRLDDKPLAYILGLAAGDGAFLDLKESFVEAYSQYSPAHVLKKLAMTALIAQGVRIYDYMGVCEPYKMRWTDKTYSRHTFMLYNSTLRGRLLNWKAGLSRSSRSTDSAAQPINAASQ